MQFGIFFVCSFFLLLLGVLWNFNVGIDCKLFNLQKEQETRKEKGISRYTVLHIFDTDIGS